MSYHTNREVTKMWAVYTRLRFLPRPESPESPGIVLCFPFLPLLRSNGSGEHWTDSLLKTLRYSKEIILKWIHKPKLIFLELTNSTDKSQERKIAQHTLFNPVKTPMSISYPEKESLMLGVSVPSRLGFSNVECKSKAQKTTESLCLAESFLPWAAHSSVCAQLFGDLAVRSSGNNSLGMNKISKVRGKNRFKKRAKRTRERQSWMGFFFPCAALVAGSNEILMMFLRMVLV